MPARTGSALLDSALWTAELLQRFHEGCQGFFVVVSCRIFVGFSERYRVLGSLIKSWVGYIMASGGLHYGLTAPRVKVEGFWVYG